MHDERAFEARVVGELAERGFDRAVHDLGSDGFITFELEVGQGLLGPDEGDAAAGDDAFLDRRTGGVEGVFDAGFLLLHLGLGRGADIDDGDTTGQLGEALLELLAVVVRGGLLDLTADLGDAALDVFALAFTFDDGGGFFFHHDALGFAEVIKGDALELDAEVFGDATAAGEDGNVFEHGLAAVAEAGGFDGADLQGATELVDHEGGEGFAFDVFRDDEERTAAFGHLLEQRKEVLQAADFLLVDEDVGVLEDGFHRLRVGREVGREIAFVELHTFDHVEGGFDRLGFFHRDGSILADLLHRVSDDLADGFVPVGRDGRDLRDFAAVGDLLRDLAEFGHHGRNGLVDAALERGRVGTGRHILEAFAINRFGQNGGGGGAVAGDVGRLRRDFADELGAHVFVRVLELDLLGDGDAVLGDGRASEFLVEDDVASGRPEGRLDRSGQFLDATEQAVPRGFIEFQLFRCHNF